MKIRTNNVPRPLLSFYELNDCQKAVLQEENDFFSEARADEWKGFMYKGELYSLDNFVIYSDGSEEKALGWDGGMAQSAFHAVIVKLADTNFDSVVVGEIFA